MIDQINELPQDGLKSLPETSLVLLLLLQNYKTKTLLQNYDTFKIFLWEHNEQN